MARHLEDLTELRAELEKPIFTNNLGPLVFKKHTSEGKHNWLPFTNPKLDMLILIKIPGAFKEKPANEFGTDS